MAILVQLSLVVLPYHLEATQKDLGLSSRFHLVQRVNNIFYLLGKYLKTNYKIAKVVEQPLKVESNLDINWSFLPFRLKNWSNTDSSLNKLVPVLLLVWLSIFAIALYRSVLLSLEVYN